MGNNHKGFVSILHILTITLGLAIQSCGMNIRDSSLSLPLQNNLGTQVRSYPVGAFNVVGKFLGNAANPNVYAALWNSDSADSALGTITPSTELMKFDFESSSNVAPPAALIGMRYFQFDIAYSQIDTFSFPEGSLVDFGDGVWQKFDAVTPLGADFSRYNTFSGATDFFAIHGYTGYYSAAVTFLLANPVYSVKKVYADSSLKVVTVYHNDNDYYLYNDNMAGAETADTLLSNLRGNLPAHTKALTYTSTQQSSFNTFANINYSEFRDQVEYFALRWGYSGLVMTNYNFGVLDFPNLVSLDVGSERTTYGMLAKAVIGTTDIHGKFPKVKSFAFKQNQYSADLDFHIPDIMQLAMSNYDSGNILLPADYDRILIELDSVKTNTGGAIVLRGGANRTAASNAAVASLTAKGMTLTLSP